MNIYVAMKRMRDASVIGFNEVERKTGHNPGYLKRLEAEKRNLRADRFIQIARAFGFQLFAMSYSKQFIIEQNLSFAKKDSEIPSSEIIRKMLESTSQTKKDTVKRIGQDDRVLDRALDNRPPKMDTLIAIANACNFEIVLQKKDNSQVRFKLSCAMPLDSSLESAGQKGAAKAEPRVKRVPDSSWKQRGLELQTMVDGLRGSGRQAKVAHGSTNGASSKAKASKSTGKKNHQASKVRESEGRSKKGSLATSGPVVRKAAASLRKVKNGTNDGRSKNYEMLRSTPIKAMNLDVKLRRALDNAGFKTLDEAFSVGDKELDSRVGPSLTDKVLDLSDRFERDPQGFLRSVTTPVEQVRRTDATSSCYTKTRPSSHGVSLKARSQGRGFTGHPGRMPSCKEADELRDFEKMASAVVGVVADHAEDAFIAEALGRVSPDVPMLRRNIQRIFELSRRGSNTVSSLRTVRALENEVPDSFLLYMLDAVQRNFDGSSAWRPSFRELGITDDASMQEVPRFLYSRIASKGFRVYTDEETEFPYFYTMLLHAGLAESDWASIWSRLILPMARDIRRGKLPSGTYPTPGILIRAASEKTSGYYLANQSASRLIVKAPEVAGPLLYRALEVAGTMYASSMGGTEPVMMSNGALPNIAMEALKTTLAEHHGGAGRAKSASGIIYFPHAELRLDLVDTERPLCIHWDGTRFPSEYAGRAVSYRVNGVTVLEAYIDSGFDSAVLKETDVRLKPAKTYDVEIELAGGASLSRGRLFSTQSFKLNRPGVYEFIQTSDGVLRQKVRPLRRNRDVYCLVSPGYRIVPGNGMELVNREELAEGYSIQVFDMDRMGCGEVRNSKGEQVSAWCESYKVTIDRSQVIGEGNAGGDLYPFVRDGDSDTYNDAMPSIAIEGLDDGFSHNQLSVECLCDGRGVSIKRTTADRIGGAGGKVVLLRLDQSSIPAFVNEGHLRVVHRESERTILTYRFSVVPIRNVSLEAACALNDGGIQATYAVHVDRECEIGHGASVQKAYRSAPRYIEVPLSDEWLSITVAPLGNGFDHDVSAQVFLAGIAIVPPMISQPGQSKDPDRYELLEMSSEDGAMSIECYGRRTNRGVYLHLGPVPRFYKMLPVASSYRITPFMPLLDAGQEDGKKLTELTLILSYECGQYNENEQANCCLGLGHVLLGYGFGECKLTSTSGGSSLCLTRPVDYDLVARFIRSWNGREKVLCEDVDVQAGTTSIDLPREVHEALSRRGDITTIFAHKDIFDEADFEQGQRITISRRGRYV